MGGVILPNPRLPAETCMRRGTNGAPPGIERGFDPNVFDGYEAYEGGVIDGTPGCQK